MTVLSGDETLVVVAAILNNEAGPNLVQEDVLPKPCLVIVQPIRISITVASDATLRVKEFNFCTLETGRHKASEVFKVVSEVVPKMILEKVLT